MFKFSSRALAVRWALLFINFATLWRQKAAKSLALTLNSFPSLGSLRLSFEENKLFHHPYPTSPLSSTTLRIRVKRERWRRSGSGKRSLLFPTPRHSTTTPSHHSLPHGQRSWGERWGKFVRKRCGGMESGKRRELGGLIFFWMLQKSGSFIGRPWRLLFKKLYFWIKLIK